MRRSPLTLSAPLAGPWRCRGFRCLTGLQAPKGPRGHFGVGPRLECSVVGAQVGQLGLGPPPLQAV